jgi:hypothetical protein
MANTSTLNVTFYVSLQRRREDKTLILVGTEPRLTGNFAHSQVTIVSNRGFLR